MYKDLNCMLSGTPRDKCECASDERISRGRADACARHKADVCNYQRERGTDGFCNTGRDSWGLVDYPLAMVYSPLQSFDKICDKQTALSRGTMFEALDLPFKGASVYKGGNCRG